MAKTVEKEFGLDLWLFCVVFVAGAALLFLVPILWCIMRKANLMREYRPKGTLEANDFVKQVVDEAAARGTLATCKA
ncbi:unnamed protein product [Vitrella brassicaformis CCMP3155]|uniref:Uncharacterized protein n=1 Tax=Vitrella brassicaformis (strain CCMP3155) TaxID=1169540 RepID=A0A0G4FA76_VITBC|nr:unnamed protein product [Vitrella brassicaformis CCMP3155]|eukprot:CEM09877.1 unnamed protein product [Vitrella brassicaformis CCMP3155]